MAKLTITIETGNDAFQPNPAPEVARILKELARKLEDGYSAPEKLYDVNGKAVGTVKETGHAASMKGKV